MKIMNTVETKMPLTEALISQLHHSNCSQCKQRGLWCDVRTVHRFPCTVLEHITLTRGIKSSFPKKSNIQSLVGLHLSCFNILLSCGRFIITIIPTCLSENWFYATRLNGALRRKNKNHHIG